MERNSSKGHLNGTADVDYEAKHRCIRLLAGITPTALHTLESSWLERFNSSPDSLKNNLTDFLLLPGPWEN